MEPKIKLRAAHAIIASAGLYLPAHAQKVAQSLSNNYNVADILHLIVTHKVDQFCGIPTFAQMFPLRNLNTWLPCAGS